MSFRGDERAVSTVVGAVLVFAILILALGVYQAQIVPAENERVEYEHSQTVGNQLQDLRNALVGTAATGNSRPASVTLGVRYPDRTFTVNPPPPDGRLQGVAFENRSNVTVANVRATNDETADYLGGSLNFSTDGIEYVPDYNEFRSAPTTRYEHGTLYDAYGNGDVERTGGIVVEDGTITLVTLNVSEGFRESGVDSVSVDPQALSAPYHSTRITNAGGNITLTLPTKANASMWQEVYEDRDNATVTPNGSAVDITLDNGSYDLRMAHLGVGREMEKPGAEYLTLVRGNGTSRVTLEVRDRYNNPVPGVGVTVGNSEFKNTTVQSGSDGRATFAYTGSSSQVVTFSIGNGDEKNVTTSVGSSSSAIGGANTYEVNTTALGLGCEGTDACTLNVGEDGTAVDLETLVSTDGEDLTGATVDYALNKSSFGTLTETDGVTTDGIHNTRLEELDSNGIIAVYAISGDGGDKVTIDVVTDGNANDPITFNNYQNFTADALNDEFTVGEVDIEDTDGDLDRVEYSIEDSSGTVVATRTDTASGSQYQVQDFVVNNTTSVDTSETYTMIVTGYDSDGDYVTETRSYTTPTYEVLIDRATATGNANNIDVVANVTTSDSSTYIRVRTLDGGTEIGNMTTQVTGTQPQTVTVKGANKADEVQVILYDGDPAAGGNERESTTVPYPYYG